MRTVIVTGGSRGIGLGIARALVGEGLRVVAVARQEGAALAAARAELGHALAFEAADLQDLAALPGLVARIRASGAIYALVNNAGIGTPGVLATMPDAAVETLLRLNVASPMLLTKYVVRSMMASGGEGRIVLVSSIVAQTGYPGLSAYSGTKAALEGFARSLAREVGPLGITVNAVAPGFVDTEMTGELTEQHRAQIARRSALKRLPAVEDVAAAVTYLLGPGGRNVTGIVLTVDAGNTA